MEKKMENEMETGGIYGFKELDIATVVYMPLSQL